MAFPLIQNQGQLTAPSLANTWQSYTKLGLKTDFAKQFGDYANQSIANNAKSLVPNNPLAGISPLTGIQQQTPPLKQSFTEKFQNSKWGQAAGMAGSMLASSYDLIPTMDKIHNSNDQLAGDLRKNISSTLMTSGNPYAMAAGFATMGIDKLGGFSDASKGLGGGNDFLNTVSSIALPGAGWFASTTDKYTMSDTLAKSSSYTGAADKSKTAMQNAGANILFGFSRAQKMIREAKRKDNMIQGIINDAEDRTSASGWYGNELRNWMDLNGGMERTHLARLGMKLPSKQDITKVRQILAKGGKIYSDKQTTNFKFGDSIEAEFPEEIEVPEFKDGGQLNVIPEGALHARKNNMEGAGKDFTHKGIPVIDKDGEQQAEIERDEIIFRKEVTVKLEELRKDGSDKAAIEAGKLLVEEIFHNTDDRTGLIAEITGEAPELTESGVEIKAEGGTINKVIEELNKLSPEKLKEFQNILKYLNQ